MPFHYRNYDTYSHYSFGGNYLYSDAKINGVDVSATDYVPTLKAWDSDVRCYCGTTLSQSNPYTGHSSGWGELRECAKCGYWRLRGGQGTRGYVYRFAYDAKLAEFSVADAGAPLAELNQYIRSHPDRLRDIHPTALEQLVAEAYRATSAYVDVMHVGKPADGGIDVVLVENDTTKHLVQVKQRKGGGVEGVSTLRNLLGAMLANETLSGILVSSADAFSSYAVRLAAAGVAADRALCYRVELVDMGKLQRLLAHIPDEPDPPWRALLRAR